MWSVIVAAASAFGVVFVAELGDKTQLLALGFGARYRLGIVAVGLAIGYGIAGAIAAVVGGVLGAALPQRPLSVAAGVLFIGFALMAMRVDERDDDSTTHVVGGRSAIASIALTIAIAEMGDKTQLATAALAAQSSPIGTWIGATTGEIAAGMIGAVAGRHLGHRLDAVVLRIASAVLFATFGVVLIATAW